ncbi:hypothetical protein [Solimicrobium silvestre]|uniref:Uncharacterized protein n=1 Tax=Solimicrobium silvestre TaxID=2099400 RepID=A0A2S9GYR0_9BURK|nr:hypothetical protein [Solimicrobium silvestre]PRC92796.1 hypothetical protein S2091_2526 [Solimicrobium silvestre]
MNANAFYRPIISAPDRLIRAPLLEWKRTCSGSLANIIRKNDMDVEKIAVDLNCLALLETYQGHYDFSLRLCTAQIRFWKKFANQPGHSQDLSKVIQPWINIIRLERWQNKWENASALYRELKQENHTVPGTLNQRYDIECNLKQLCELDQKFDYVNLLNVVYWREYANLLLQSNALDELQQFLGAGFAANINGSLKVSLLEILLSYLTKIGSYENALSILKKIKAGQSGEFWLHFKILEMFLSERTNQANASLLIMQTYQAAISEKYIQRNSYGLNLLHSISHVFKELDIVDLEIDLLNKTAKIAEELGDEVTLFEVMSRLADLHEIPQKIVFDKFAHSSYALIRGRLGLPLSSTAELEESRQLVLAVEAFAQLDYVSCLDLLQAESGAELFG